MRKRTIMAFVFITLFAVSMAFGYCDGVCGDVTGDGSVDISDVQAFIYCYANPPTPYDWETCLAMNWGCGDVNNDGSTNTLDMYVLIDHLFVTFEPLDCGS